MILLTGGYLVWSRGGTWSGPGGGTWSGPGGVPGLVPGGVPGLVPGGVPGLVRWVPDRPPRSRPPRSRHPLGADTPPREQTPPPPGADTPPRSSRLRNTVYEQPVHILLECIRVACQFSGLYVKLRVVMMNEGAS